jgi:hypothetical protein
MSVTLDGEVVRLSGPCRVEDAEILLGMLAGDGRLVDVTQAGHLHAAVLQVLMAFEPEIVGPAADEFVAYWLKLGRPGALPLDPAGGSAPRPASVGSQ